MKKALSIAIVLSSLMFVSRSHAQKHPVADFFRDYFKLVPRAYSPDDPWRMGHVLRTEVGHGGLFYNCDGEEQKRYSPYIRWNCQNVDRPKRLIQDPLLCQLREVRQRVRWGACAECDTGFHPAHGRHGKTCNCASVTPVVPQANQLAAKPPQQPVQQIEQFPKRLEMPPQNVQYNHRQAVHGMLQQSRQAAKVAQSPQHSQRKVVHGLLEQARQEKKLPFAQHHMSQPSGQASSVAARDNIAKLLQQANGRETSEPTEMVREPTQPSNAPPEKSKGGFLVQLLSPVDSPRGRGMGVAPRQSESIATTRTARNVQESQAAQRREILPVKTVRQQPASPSATEPPVRQAQNQVVAPASDAEFRMIRR